MPISIYEVVFKNHSNNIFCNSFPELKKLIAHWEEGVLIRKRI